MAINPIDKTQRERLNGAKRRLTDAHELCQRCKNCGIEVSERERAIAFLYDQLMKLESNFNGPQPSSISPTADGNSL